MPNNISWDINLEAFFTGTWIVETTEGARRTGKITKVNFKEVTIAGRVVQCPDTIEMNEDASDFIQWNLIQSIQRA